MVQLSHLYMTTGKAIAFIETFVGQVMAVLFNASGFVIDLLPRSKRLFNFVAAVTIHSDFGDQENKICQFPLFPHLFAMK